MVREIINIDEEKCDGCGLCIPGCPEGALQIIDGKARLVSDLMCDGLGACLGECPLEAITIEKREAEMYNETEVIKVISKQGKNTTIAHLRHLQEHGEMKYFNEAVEYLNNHQVEVKFNISETIKEMKKQNTSGGKDQSTNPGTGENPAHHPSQPGCSCPGAAAIDFRQTNQDNDPASEFQSINKPSSELRQWPIQMHLVNPMAPYFRDCDLILVADCIPFAMADFHHRFLKGKSLAIACPKLDINQELYVEKLTAMINEANLNTITVMIMEVPCCGNLVNMAITAVHGAKRNIPVKMIRVGLRGDVLEEAWM